jgi:hypothetical protein
LTFKNKNPKKIPTASKNPETSGQNPGLGNADVLAKLRNPEPTMPQWNVTLATTKKKPKKFLAFQQGQIMTLAAANVISPPPPEYKPTRI